MEKPTNYFYQYLEAEGHYVSDDEKGHYVPTDEEIEIIIRKYVHDHFQEMFDALIKRIARVIMEQK